MKKKAQYWLTRDSGTDKDYELWKGGKPVYNDGIWEAVDDGDTETVEGFCPELFHAATNIKMRGGPRAILGPGKFKWVKA